MKRERSLTVLGAVAAGLTLVGALAVGCGGGNSSVFVPVDSAGDNDENPGRQTLVEPALRGDLASLLEVSPRES